MIPKLLTHTLVRYLVVGGFSYLVEMGVLYLLKIQLGWTPVAAVSVSFWIGFVVAFVLQKFIAFQNHDKRVKTVASQLLAYSALVAWNYVFTLGLTKLLEDSLNVFIIRTIAIITITTWNYVAYRVLFRQTSR